MKKVIKPPIKPTKKQNVKPIKPTKKQNVKPIKPVKPTKKQNVKPIKPVKIAKLKIAIGKITAQLIKNNPKLLRGGSGITDLLFNKKLMRGGVLTDGQKNDIEDFLKTNAKKVHELKEEFVDDVIIEMYDNKTLHSTEDAPANGYNIFYDNFTQGNVYDYKTETLNRFFTRKGAANNTKIEKSETLAILKIIELFANMEGIDKTIDENYKTKVRDENAVNAFKAGKVQPGEPGGNAIKKYVEDLKKARAGVNDAKIKVDNTEGDRGNLERDGELEGEGLGDGGLGNGRLGEAGRGEGLGNGRLEEAGRREGLRGLGDGGLGNGRLGKVDKDIRRADTLDGRKSQDFDVPDRLSASVGHQPRDSTPFLLGDSMRGNRLEEGVEEGIMLRGVGITAPVGEEEVEKKNLNILKIKIILTDSRNIFNYFLDCIDVITDVVKWSKEQKRLIYTQIGKINSSEEIVVLNEGQNKLLTHINKLIPEYQRIMGIIITIYSKYRFMDIVDDTKYGSYKDTKGISTDTILDDVTNLQKLNTELSELCDYYKTDVSTFLNIFDYKWGNEIKRDYTPKTYDKKSNRTPGIPYIMQEEASGGAPVKYKSTGQVVFILYKKKKYKRTIFVKEKRKTRYCKINSEYILLSKLKVIE